MSDLEQELTGALAQVAEDAPGAVGLADAARRRHRVRRQRRLALGGAAAALVVGASAVVWGAGGDDRATDPADDPAPDGWQTISQDDVRAEVPADWQKVTCPDSPGSRWAPPAPDPCGDWRGAGFFGSATFDPVQGPGVPQRSDDGTVGGYVSAGSFVLSVSYDDPSLIRRILATARVDGQPAVDGSTWVAFDRSPLRYEVPAWWGVGEDGDHGGYSVCSTLAKGQEPGPPDQVDPAHVVVQASVGDRLVTVTAPTQAVAELVLATVEVDGRARGDQPCAPEDFAVGLVPGGATPGAGTPVEEGETAVPGDDPTGNAPTGDLPDEDFPAAGEPGWDVTLAEYDGITAEIPTYWKENPCNDAPQWTPYEDCTRPGEGLRLYGAGYPVDLGKDAGVLWSEDIDGRGYWTGYVLRGDVAVFMTHSDKDTAQILLDQVR